MKISAMLMLTLCISISCASQNNFNNISEKDGMVGIGTTTPDKKLTVKGTIHTQEVLVDLNGAVAPDFVFQKYFTGASSLKSEYTMMDLKTLENYIKANHHLPAIPSAATLDKEGIALKEMNLLLLQKIEELTLYTIEQQKQIELLSTQIKNLTPQ